MGAAARSCCLSSDTKADKEETTLRKLEEEKVHRGQQGAKTRGQQGAKTRGQQGARVRGWARGLWEGSDRLSAQVRPNLYRIPTDCTVLCTVHCRLWTSRGSVQARPGDSWDSKGCGRAQTCCHSADHARAGDRHFDHWDVWQLPLEHTAGGTGEEERGITMHRRPCSAVATVSCWKTNAQHGRELGLGRLLGLPC